MMSLTARVWVTRVYPGFHRVRFFKNQGGLKLPCDGTKVKLLKIVTKQGKTRVESDLPSRVLSQGDENETVC